ncbi:MAG: ABC transporter substrate-binding protein [Inquilinaceae bacterium]
MTAKTSLVFGSVLAMSTLVAGGAVAQSSDEALAMSWDQIVAAADGGTVNWFMWGGSDTINSYVSDWVGSRVKEQYNITLNRVGINDTVEAVNTVLGETEAGVDDNGSVDMIWINGENFRTMKQGDLLFCGYTDMLPNDRYINWNDSAVAFDFGTAVEGCEVPWGRAQVALGYNTATVNDPPRTIPALIEWIKANPGRFTYPAPPDFTGSVFVRHVFYHAAGGVDRLLGDFDQALYDEVSEKTWVILNDLEPSLWREGNTYPNDSAALTQLFANQEVDFTITYEPSSIGLNVINGTFPDTVSSYALDDGTIGNVHYVAIPRNSPNKAAAMVLANYLISPEAQFQKAQPDVWGVTTALDPARIPSDWASQFESIPRHPSVVGEDELAERSLPELTADWLTAIEKGWIENVGR